MSLPRMFAVTVETGVTCGSDNSCETSADSEPFHVGRFRLFSSAYGEKLWRWRTFLFFPTGTVTENAYGDRVALVTAGCYAQTYSAGYQPLRKRCGPVIFSHDRLEVPQSLCCSCETIKDARQPRGNEQVGRMPSLVNEAVKVLC